MNSLVSIITPSYNSSRFINECIESVIAQTYGEWEMIIVDDCSTDESVELISEIISNEPRIQLIVSDKNIGAAEARNVAISQAKGRYIAFLDSDDIWLPEKLERQLRFMKKNEYEFTFGAYIPISEDGKEEYGIIQVPESIDYDGYLKNTIIGCLTVILDKEKTGFFRMPDIRSSHDMALWLDILSRGFNAYGMQEVLGKYRLVSTSNTSKKINAIKEVWEVYRDVRGLSFMSSLYYWIHYVYNATKKRL